jgi:hypothetical protein
LGIDTSIIDNHTSIIDNQQRGNPHVLHVRTGSGLLNEIRRYLPDFGSDYTPSGVPQPVVDAYDLLDPRLGLGSGWATILPEQIEQPGRSSVHFWELPDCQLLPGAHIVLNCLASVHPCLLVV